MKPRALPGARQLIDRWMRPSVLLAVAGLCLALAAVCWYANRSSVGFDADSDQALPLQVFHSANGGFSEDASRRITTGPGVEKIEMLLPGNTGQLRFDPKPGIPVTICNLRVDGKPAALTPGAAHEADIQSLHGGCLRIAPQAGATDPYVQVAVRAEGADDPGTIRIRSWITRAAALATVIALVVFFWRLDRWASTASTTASRWFDALTRRAHWVVLFAMLVLGSVYAHQLPPNGVPDEVAHISKVAKLEAGALFGDAGNRPTVRVLDMYGPFHNIVHGGPFSAQEFALQEDQPLGCDRHVQKLPTQADNYAPHLYLVPATTLSVACATGMSFGSYLTLSRILNLLLGATLVAIGVRFAGYGKWSLALVALLPMALAQIASISADSLTLGLSFCILGLVSGIASGNLEPGRVRIALPVLALALAFAKPGAAWVLVSILFCHAAYRRSGDSYVRAVLTVLVLPWIVHLAWALFSSSSAAPLAGVDPQRNLEQITTAPLSVARILLETFSGDSGEYLLDSSIGLLGWLDVPLTDRSYLLAAAALAVSLFVNPRLPPIPVWVRGLALLAAIGSLVIIALPLFLYWTYPDSPTVMGLQGRYFLPSLAFFLVWAALRAPPIARAMMLAAILVTVPLLTFDAREQIAVRYYALAH